jgi:hypothetical protein
MSDFNVGDRVRDVCWDGTFVGTVMRVDEDGAVFVRWHDTIVEDQMSPNQIVKEGA